MNLRMICDRYMGINWQLEMLFLYHRWIASLPYVYPRWKPNYL